MTKAERAIKAYREAADAWDSISFHRFGVFIPLNSTSLRAEADYIEKLTSNFSELQQEAE